MQEQLVALIERETKAAAQEALRVAHVNAHLLALTLVNEAVWNPDIDDAEKVRRVQAAMRTWLRQINEERAQLEWEDSVREEAT